MVKFNLKIVNYPFTLFEPGMWVLSIYVQKTTELIEKVLTTLYKY